MLFNTLSGNISVQHNQCGLIFSLNCVQVFNYSRQLIIRLLMLQVILELKIVYSLVFLVTFVCVVKQFTVPSSFSAPCTRKASQAT